MCIYQGLLQLALSIVCPFVPIMINTISISENIKVSKGGKELGLNQHSIQRNCPLYWNAKK